MRKLMILAMSLALLAGGAWAQQSGNSATSRSNAAQSTPPGTVALPGSRPAVANDALTREVLHELLMVANYSVFDNLAFQVNGNDVTLMGQVVDPIVKSEAESNVKSIKGIGHVTDNIEILPPSEMDNQIRREEYRAIYSFGPLYKYAWGAVPGIHIIVKNGRVALVGMVDNQADKDAAGIRANGVPGVFAVQNDLAVASNRTK